MQHDEEKSQGRFLLIRASGSCNTNKVRASGSCNTNKCQKIKIEKQEIVDLTGDPQYIDSAEGYDPEWKSSKPNSPIPEPRKSCYPKPGKYMRPTAKLGATSKPASRGSATSSSAASSENLDEPSYTYGKKRGRGFLLPEESSDSAEDSSED